MAKAKRTHKTHPTSKKSRTEEVVVLDEPAPVPATPRTKIIFSVVILGVFAALLFTRLGHYSFWDDEANTALFAEALWKTGDLSAVHGNNVVAYRNGVELDDKLRHRLLPPLGYVWAAPFVGIFGRDAFFCRLPFALAAWFTVALMVYWLWRSKASAHLWVLMTIALCGNVSLMLFGRQCRYYALAILFTLTTTYLYYHRSERWRSTIALIVSSCLLMASHYLAYAALHAALAVDYLVWDRKRRTVPMKHLVTWGLTQLVVGILLVSTFNPLGKEITIGYQPDSFFVEHLPLLWFNLRDLNHSEVAVGILMLLAPVIYVWKRNSCDMTLLRLFLGILIFVVTTSLFSPQPAKIMLYADVRYIVPLVPACVALGALVLHRLRISRWAVYAIALIAFHTTLFHSAMALVTGGNAVPLRSTTVSFLTELVHPNPDPIKVVSQWIDENVPEGKAVWIRPDFMTYPLMFHAPHVLYAWQINDWQLNEAAKAKFSTLPEIHFGQRTPPDYVIFFGPEVHTILAGLMQWSATKNIRYEKTATIPMYWDNRIRPELFWHYFEPITEFNLEQDAIYIFKQMP